MVTKTRRLRGERLLLRQLPLIVPLVMLAFVCVPTGGWSNRIPLTLQNRQVSRTCIDYKPPFDQSIVNQNKEVGHWSPSENKPHLLTTRTSLFDLLRLGPSLEYSKSLVNPLQRFVKIFYPNSPHKSASNSSDSFSLEQTREGHPKDLLQVL